MKSNKLFIPYFIVGFPGRLTWISFVRCAESVGVDANILIFPDKNLKTKSKLLNIAFQNAYSNEIAMDFFLQSIGRYKKFSSKPIFVAASKESINIYGYEKFQDESNKQHISDVLFLDELFSYKQIKIPKYGLFRNLDSYILKDTKILLKYVDGVVFGKKLVEVIYKNTHIKDVLVKIEMVLKKYCAFVKGGNYEV